MREIWQYEIPLVDKPEIKMPRGAQVLNVCEHGGQVYVCVIVNPDEPLEYHKFQVAGVEEPLDWDADSLKTFHIGTVVMSTGFVWHVWDFGYVRPIPPGAG